MRKCIRCQADMIEDYGLKISNFMAGVAPVILSEGQGVFNRELEKIKAAVCPNCKEVSIYISEFDKIKKKDD